MLKRLAIERVKREFYTTTSEQYMDISENEFLG